MLLFCPLCSNTLTVTRIAPSPHVPEALIRRNRLTCRTCPYQHILTRRWFERRRLGGTGRRAEGGDDIILAGAGGATDAWGTCEETDAQCPERGCGGTRARFYQMQIRSADEPMTSFFKCVKCGKEWREN